MIQFVEKSDDLIFSVRVVPKSSKSEIVGEHDGALKIKLKAPPVDGAANAELIAVLAKHFCVSKNQIEILKGHASKTKQIKISGGTAANLPDLKTA